MCTGVTYITAYFNTHVQEGTDVYGSHVYHSLLQHARSRWNRCVRESRVSQLNTRYTGAAQLLILTWRTLHFIQICFLTENLNWCVGKETQVTNKNPDYDFKKIPRTILYKATVLTNQALADKATVLTTTLVTDVCLTKPQC